MTTALDLNDPFSSAELKKIRRVEFGLLSPSQVVAMSVCKIDTGNIYLDGVPVRGGLNDPRTGTIDVRKPCETCGMKLKECPGHFGHIELAKPMYHYGFLKTALKALRCVCMYCSKLLCDGNDASVIRAMRIKHPKSRLQAMQVLGRSKKVCASGGMLGAAAQLLMDPKQAELTAGTHGCGYLQPKYTLDGTTIVVTFPVDEEGLSNGENGGREGKGASRKPTDEAAGTTSASLVQTNAHPLNVGANHQAHGMTEDEFAAADHSSSDGEHSDDTTVPPFMQNNSENRAPAVNAVPDKESDLFMLLCSDGVWEFISSGEAVKIASKFPKSRAPTAAEELARVSWDRWMIEENGHVVDDITALVVHL